MPIYALLVATLIAAMLVSATVGYRIYDLGQLWDALFHFDGTEAATVLTNLRLPRAVIAPLVGAALGIAGVQVQTLSRNRIASPDTLGLNAGASLAVVVASSVFGIGSLAGLSLTAALGALVTSLVVFAIAAGAGGLSPLRIVLIGVTIAGLGQSFVQIILTTNEAQLQNLLFWLAGSFVDRPMTLVINCGPFVLVGAVIAFLLARPLDALQADDSTATSLGVPVGLVRIGCFFSVALLTGAAVAMAGPVSFVGLVVPHAARRLVGLRHDRQIIAAALVGAVYTTLADVAARFVIFPLEAPVGAVTAVVGGIVLVLLLRRRIA
ncbi:FecCD family ABC transporter permease [Devosia naphthalenivorans]|uniref:FecCD family ABC transporter permease n=1 Tax=Devosia naphthalenivorans TaxID=2082392 RepID=UPI001FE4F18E|nr:iron ABC transporter permease [Devosia naphthalenivorans]